MDKMVSINNERLIYARNNYNLSIEDVSRKTGIKSEDILRFEQGEDFPSYSKLERLSDVYKQSFFFFFVSDAPPEKAVEFAFRNNENINVNALSLKTYEMIEKANIYRINLEELYKSEDRVFFVDHIKKDKVNSDDSLSSWLRKKISLSLQKQKEFRNTSELAEYIRNGLYELGIYIFKDSFRDHDVSGLCLYDKKYPVILINNKTSFTRQLFTIFHEVYHIYLEQSDVDYTNYAEENACNRFASSFLMPESDFNKNIQKLRFENDSETADSINYLANLYKTSRDSIMYRLLQKDIISQSYYTDNKASEEVIRGLNAASSGGDFYRTRISYLGKHYLLDVFNAYYGGKISSSKVSILTNLKQSNVSTLASYVGG